MGGLQGWCTRGDGMSMEVMGIKVFGVRVSQWQAGLDSVWKTLVCARGFSRECHSGESISVVNCVGG